MIPIGFVYLFQINFYFLSSLAVLCSCKLNNATMYLHCFKEQLRFTAGSLALFPPTISVQNMIKSSARGTWRDGRTATPHH